MLYNGYRAMMLERSSFSTYGAQIHLSQSHCNSTRHENPQLRRIETPVLPLPMELAVLAYGLISCEAMGW